MEGKGRERKVDWRLSLDLDLDLDLMGEKEKKIFFRAKQSIRVESRYQESFTVFYTINVVK